MARRALLGLMVPFLLCTGCWFHGPGDLKRELSDSAGVELDQEIGITLGRSSMWIARKAVRWSGEEDIPSLKGVRKVQVGVYEVRGLKPGRDRRQQLQLSDLPPNWIPVVQVHDDGEDVFVLTQEDGERIKAMLVVVAEYDEWVIVRIKGNLNRIIEEAMQMAFDEAGRPELYERSREERGLEPEAETVTVSRAD